jgi:hypothetical protein
MIEVLELLGLLAIRCFYVVQKQKRVADAMIKADTSPPLVTGESLPHVRDCGGLACGSPAASQ